jgi:hypothetical protein
MMDKWLYKFFEGVDNIFEKIDNIFVRIKNEFTKRFKKRKR